jgi:diguanylate cyclase (GGDEF)-like protein/PAS domain S-box-containing protein
VSAPFPHVDLVSLLGAAADDGVESAIRAALRPFPSACLFVFDTELRLHLAEGPAAEAAGYATAGVRGRRLDDVVPEAVAAILRPNYRAALVGENRQFQIADPASGRRFTCEAGPIRDADGVIVGVACLALDVGESDARLEQAERRYRLLAETATELVSLHDLEGRWLYVSPSAATVLGRDPDSLVGRPSTELVHPDDVDELQRTVAGLIAAGDSALVTHRTLRGDGTYVWLESSIRVIRTPAGRARELRVSSRDITARKEHERRAEEATAELRQRLAQTAAIVRLGDLALENPDLGALLDAAAQAVADTLDVTFTSVLELRGPSEPLIARAGIGWSRGLAGALIDPPTGDAGAALDLLADGAVVAGDERFRTRAYDEHDVVSAAHVLIGDRDNPWGVLSAASTDPRDFDASDRDFLQAVAHVIGDAVERRRAEEAARHEALHDPLTGLPNRALLVDRLTHTLRRRPNARAAVLVLDIDDFKVVNDSLGHEVGDQLLTEVGPRLAAALRPGDTIARFSGDTFAVVCEDITDETHARRLAERLTTAFARPFELAGERVFVSASVGAVVSTGRERAEDLVRDADAAMHRAKEAGSGRYELFDPRLRQRAIARLRTESDLRRALDRGELRVHYQPFWSLPDRRLAGVEALVRWQHPQRGLVLPGEFVPVAEAGGLIVPIGTWVLREACRQLAAWRREHPGASELRLRVNLSARQVTEPGLVELVAAALDEHDIEPSAVGLEITEGLLLQDSDAVADTLRALKTLGVGLVLDDFGTGYSSLSYLKRFPIDQLKIDRSFVIGLDERDENLALVAAIVGMAAALGLTVVPEGVETEGQLAVLQELGCHYAQGFLLAEPMPPDAVTALL